MKKGVFELEENDIIILDGEEYKFVRAFRKRLPRLGMSFHREFRNIKTGKKQLFINNHQVEVKPTPQ